jgi:hypothetical protein
MNHIPQPSKSPELYERIKLISFEELESYIPSLERHIKALLLKHDQTDDKTLRYLLPRRGLVMYNLLEKLYIERNWKYYQENPSVYHKMLDIIHDVFDKSPNIEAYRAKGLIGTRPKVGVKESTENVNTNNGNKLA